MASSLTVAKIVAGLDRPKRRQIHIEACKCFADYIVTGHSTDIRLDDDGDNATSGRDSGIPMPPREEDCIKYLHFRKDVRSIQLVIRPFQAEQLLPETLQDKAADVVQNYSAV